MADHSTTLRIVFALGKAGHDDVKKLAANSKRLFDADWVSAASMRLVRPSRDKRRVRATTTATECDHGLALASRGGPASPTSSEAWDITLRAKGKNLPSTFIGAAHPATACLIAACGDKRVTDHNRADAITFQDLLLARLVSGPSLIRTFGYMKPSAALWRRSLPKKCVIKGAAQKHDRSLPPHERSMPSSET